MAMLFFPQREEPFYCSPAYGTEDIICDGSDTEENDDEVQRKRLRYEDQAQRYMRGHLPVLQSVVLRGPLDANSGWVNPWRFRPRKYSDSRTSGCESPYVQDSVMTGGLVNSKEPLSPSEGCSRWNLTASKEPESAPGVEFQEHISQSPSRKVDQDGSQGYWKSKSTPEAENYMQGRCTSTNTHIQNNTTGEFAPSLQGGIRGRKRAADSQWLKGAYISKRARWNESATLTPTPLSNLPRRRGQEWREVLTGTRSQPDEDRSSSHSEALSQDLLPQARKLHDQNLYNLSKPPETSINSSIRKLPPALTSSDNDLRQGSESDDNGDQECDTEDARQCQYREQKFIFNAAGQTSSAESQMATSSVSTSGYPNLDVEYSPVGSSYGLEHSLATPVSNNHSPQTHSTSVICHEKSSGQSEEDSFVTEVAPSSQNLEHFEYRKKRPRPRHLTPQTRATPGNSASNHLSTPISPPLPEDDVVLKRHSSRQLPSSNKLHSSHSVKKTISLPWGLYREIKQEGENEVPFHVPPRQDTPNDFSGFSDSLSTTLVQDNSNIIVSQSDDLQAFTGDIMLSTPHLLLSQSDGQCKVLEAPASEHPPAEGERTAMDALQEFPTKGAEVVGVEEALVSSTITSPQSPSRIIIIPDEQSPWVPSDLPAPLMSVPSHTTNVNSTIDSNRAGVLSLEGGSLSSQVAPSEGVGWQYVARYSTPEEDRITPFRDIVSSPAAASGNDTRYDLPSTQQLVNDASNNAWRSHGKKTTSGKSRKRVSFGVASPDRESPAAMALSIQGPRSPPPPKSPEILEESFDDGTAVSGFKKHFNTFKHPPHLILPPGAPLTCSSPPVGAMAEAFVAADRETSLGLARQQRMLSESSRYLQPQSEAITNIAKHANPNKVRSVSRVLFADGDSKGHEGGLATGFNMDEVLSEAGNFLQDWSVDIELQRGRAGQGIRALT